MSLKILLLIGVSMGLGVLIGTQRSVSDELVLRQSLDACVSVALKAKN